MDASRDVRVAPSVVVICDPNLNRKSAIRCALSAADLILVESDSSISQLPPNEVVLVAWDLPAATSMARWTALGAEGNVVCYGDGADQWPITKRCEPLLAGASVLLDSATSNFAET